MPRQKTAKTIAKDIEKSFREHRQLLLDSMRGLDKGSRAYLDRLTALANLERKYRQERADRGLDPQDLGAVTRVEYVFTATTSAAPDTRTAERKLLEERYNKEFGYSAYGDEDKEDEEPAATPAPQKKSTKRKSK